LNKFILADGHVHFHECFDSNLFISSASQNFCRISPALDDQISFQCVLFFTDSEVSAGFKLFFSKITEHHRSEHSPLLICSTKEETALQIKSPSKPDIFVISGHQILTFEGIEVLSLASKEKIQDGKPLAEVIEHIKITDGIPVIPWGVGKWFGKRGQILENFIDNNEVSQIFLGDNGGRPIFWPTPSLLKIGLRKGMKILPGSDPLPFKSENRKAGSFGFILEGDIDPDFPTQSLKRLIFNSPKTPRSYGRLESPIRFFINQLKMQKRKIFSR
jgi:hypothetical protein